MKKSRERVAKGLNLRQILRSKKRKKSKFQTPYNVPITFPKVLGKLCSVFLCRYVKIALRGKTIEQV